MRDIDSLEGDPRFKDVVWEILQLHAAKQADYGSTGDPFANVRKCDRIGIPPWKGVIVRLMDKWTRIENFALKGVLANESFEDALMDNAVYSMIDIVLYREATAT